ncbi:MAG TPA: prepilin-type N-terminal cleavage/methylation domain-containing protein [Longimicrobiaceae bacterium]|jgi:prepilin-type N-terminal cleavage/methylation domain-containing protein|nr:prepilin-type N-terminal cleavage/methylation domain-containing protein [Longimicrobiaceae bacterium]
MKNLRNNKGFTLIELMIVVVIIGILAAIAIPKFSKVSAGAKQAEAYGVLAQICGLQKSYFEAKDTYAASEGTLTGWADPSAKYYTFTSTGSATAASAVATPNSAGSTAGVKTITRNCVTGTDVES